MLVRTIGIIGGNRIMKSILMFCLGFIIGVIWMLGMGLSFLYIISLPLG